MKSQFRQNRFQLPFKKADMLWWEIFPVTIGDRVKLIKSGGVGRVVAMTIPVCHSGEMDFKTEHWLRTEFEILLEGELAVRGVKRWELEKYPEEE